MDKAEQKIVDDVKRYGVHIMQVFGDEEFPEFSYTIGLYESYKHPEVIIIGLKNDLSKVLLNNVNYDIKNGKEYLPGQFYNGVLDDFPCYFGTASPTNQDFPTGFANWYYKDKDFPLLQCVCPTVKGKFPWDEDFPEDARFYFPLLIKPPKT